MSPQPPPVRAEPAPPAHAFRFGRNWQRYVANYLDPERERIAAESLRDLLQTDLAGRSFLDIGSGSGLFSLCAFKAGASRVTSIDVDSEAVESTRQLRASVGDPGHWIVCHDSILDHGLLDELGRADVVYSWGVLHHTGRMEEAIVNAAGLVAPGGLFCIAIYNRVTDRRLDSEAWLRLKRAYNYAPRWVQIPMEWAYGGYFALGCLKSRRNPLRVAREYKASRGMALWTDLIDWLGGFPYEFATAGEIIDLCQATCGLTLVRCLPIESGGTGNNQFVFRRPIA